MVNVQFSEAVMAYVGIAGRFDARPPEDRVAEALGDDALDIVPRIKAMLDDMYSAEPPLWNYPDIAEVGRRAESWLRAQHPELSDAAIRAVTNRFCFNWR